MEPVHSNTRQEQKFQYVHNSGKIICVYRAYVERRWTGASGVTIRTEGTYQYLVCSGNR